MAVSPPRMRATTTYFMSPPWACSSTVLSTAWVSVTRASLPRGQQVDDGEDHDPDHVDEVPVEAGDLHRLRPLLDAAAEGEAGDRQQHDDAQGHVGAVEAGEDEERAAGHVGGEAHALPDERRELVDLARQEHHAEERRGHQ